MPIYLLIYTIRMTIKCFDLKNNALGCFILLFIYIDYDQSFILFEFSLFVYLYRLRSDRFLSKINFLAYLSISMSSFIVYRAEVIQTFARFYLIYYIFL